jgi:hypothetical protein
MLRVFPAALLLGIAVTILQRAKATGSLEKKSLRFILATGVTGLFLFLLPATTLGSVLQPWQDFAAKTALHDRGVYVNHLGLRGVALFEPSHLSLEQFVETFKSAHNPDIVRRWQDIKEQELQKKRPLIGLAAVLVLICLAAIIWKRKAHESESVLWPLLLVYTVSFASHYYYAFLCLLVLLFFRRANSLAAFVPLCLLLLLNISILVADAFRPSPIVFYTVTNISLFVCLLSILGFELYANVLRAAPMQSAASVHPPPESRPDVKRRRKTRARSK